MSFEMQNLPGLFIFGCVLKPTVVDGQTENLIFYHSECNFGTKVLAIIKIPSKQIAVEAETKDRVRAHH